jgi:hypothetical protein
MIMDLATQEKATQLLGSAAGMFQRAMDNGGRLDAAGEFTQWLEDYRGAFEVEQADVPEQPTGGA